MVMSERAIRLGTVNAPSERRAFIGGSDARAIMGNDEEALLRLWREKRGEAERPDYSDNLVAQLGLATQPLNPLWYDRATWHVRQNRHTRSHQPVHPLIGSTLG